jgi:SAM-dependent methyltransferase
MIATLTVAEARKRMAQRAGTLTASVVRRVGLWALGSLGGFVARQETLPGWTQSLQTEVVEESVRLQVEEGIAEYIRAHPDDLYAATAARIDRLRYTRSLEWIRRQLRPTDRVLELGGGGMFTALFKRCHPNVEVVSSGFELRQPFPIESAAYDVVLCMETIEHICDVSYHHATTLTGVQNCLSEAYRVLKPGGTLFLTTPNAAGAYVIHRALNHQPPWNWEWHFREFTFFEIAKLVTDAGFEMIRGDTVNAWAAFGTAPVLLGYTWLTGASIHGRGDNIFILARRAG